MKPQTPVPPRPAPATQADQSADRENEKDMDRELDQELDDTFPASDPLPWSHEVK